MELVKKNMDAEIDSLSTDLTANHRLLARKTEKDDLREIWEYFERFALYDDLKDLNHKVMPEIFKFEKRLMQHDAERETLNEVIRKLDASLSTKSNKQTIREIYDYIDRELK